METKQILFPAMTVIGHRAAMAERLFVHIVYSNRSEAVRILVWHVNLCLRAGIIKLVYTREVWRARKSTLKVHRVPMMQCEKHQYYLELNPS